ncbi:hypothetical protein LO772_04995 [Yinghuangia sp. ASG 101]|uniref:hypothetical protein n=1 Tax=Yinghuangia sp. ASG 101 TaxID=2896848 RepID=UPI001E3C9D63|nr:hypothetical protein [Yinghuangia sp. ASG 101]UGQ12982.1 hypothetical protein LO772_04995 [Yinghuangia sp. ASG 101]
MALTRNPAPANVMTPSTRTDPDRPSPKPVRMSTARRALGRIATGAVRTHAGAREGAPGISARTLSTLDSRDLVRFGEAVPGRGRPVRATRAGSRALIARGPAGTAAWLWLLDQDEVWVAADGRTFLIAEMPPKYCGNAAAWLQRHAAEIRRYAAPQRRFDPLTWIDAKPLTRALVESAAD